MRASADVLRQAVTARIFYGWYVAASGAALSLITFGIASLSLGIFITPMRDEMGWSLAAISLGFSLRSFEQGLLAPVGGMLVDRFGPRRLAIGGVVILTAGLLVFSQARDLWVYYLASVTIAVGQSLGAGNPINAAVMNWFQKRRGQAMGLVTAGRGGGYFIPPILAVGVATIGWRETAFVSAVIVLAICLPCALLLRDRPEMYGYLPDGDDPATMPASGSAVAKPTPSSLQGVTVKEALRTPAFYLLSFSTAFAGSTSVAWTVHQVPHMEDVGFSVGEAGLVIALYGAWQIALRPFVGWLADVVGRRRLFIASFLFQGVGLVVFAYLTADHWWMLIPYYLIYATGHAIWVVLFITAVADYFGTRRFATLQGLTSTLLMPFGVLAPFLAGVAFDATDSYRLIFTLYGGVAALGALCVLLIRRPPGWGAEPVPARTS